MKSSDKTKYCLQIFFKYLQYMPCPICIKEWNIRLKKIINKLKSDCIKYLYIYMYVSENCKNHIFIDLFMLRNFYARSIITLERLIIAHTTFKPIISSVMFDWHSFNTCLKQTIFLRCLFDRNRKPKCINAKYHDRLILVQHSFETDIIFAVSALIETKNQNVLMQKNIFDWYSLNTRLKQTLFLRCLDWSKPKIYNHKSHSIVLQKGIKSTSVHICIYAYLKEKEICSFFLFKNIKPIVDTFYSKNKCILK